jgi:hypothetical protein
VSLRSASATIVLETEELSVSILAERGGKVTSLLDRARAREWLVLADHELSGSADDSMLYDEGDLCGWDEMMPTITPCRLPGTDIELPEHGELWRGAWEVLDESPTSVTMRAERDLGYSFERTLTLDGATLVCDYRVVATGERTLELLWAAHPFVALRPETRLTIEGVDEFIDVTTEGERVLVEWPDDGFVVAAAMVPSTGRKLFARACAQRVDASLTDADGAWLTWSWASSDAPWLGLWLDHGSLSRHVVAVIEPTNADDDSLEVASRSKQSWVLAPRDERRWRLCARVSSEHAR